MQKSTNASKSQYLICSCLYVPGSSRAIQIQRAALLCMTACEPNRPEKICPRTALLREGPTNGSPYFVYEEAITRTGVDLRQTLSEAIGRAPTEEEFIPYLMHPKDALSFIEFRERYGMAPLVLPTDVWRNGLRCSGDKVDFELDGKPYCIELVSVGTEHEGVIHVVLKVNNVIRAYPVATPRARKVEIRIAKGPNEIGAPINGNVWRIGNPQRGPIHVGDVVHKGEEVVNLEEMKMEHAILAPFSGRIVEVCINLNDVVKEGQLLFVLEKNA